MRAMLEPETSLRIAAAFALLAGCLVVSSSTAEESASPAPVEEILTRFAEDYASDPTFEKNTTFGVQIKDEMWTITARTAKPEKPAQVTVTKGEPETPTYFFTMDFETLEKLDQKILNPGTAMVKAFSTDSAPLEVDSMPGYAPPDGFVKDLMKVCFHFWNRGFPEIIPYGESHTRFTHGADTVVFYYQPGFRSGWARVKKGQHANKDPRSRSNPFPSLFIITKGKGKAKIGSKLVDLEAGTAFVIPAGISHEFWNENHEPLELILLMFGDGA